MCPCSPRNINWYHAVGNIAGWGEIPYVYNCNPEILCLEKKQKNMLRNNHGWILPPLLFSVFWAESFVPLSLGLPTSLNVQTWAKPNWRDLFFLMTMSFNYHDSTITPHNPTKRFRRNSLLALGVGLQVVGDTGLDPGAYAVVRPWLGRDSDVPLLARLDRPRHLHSDDVLVLIQLAPELLDRPLVFIDLLLLFLDQFIFDQQRLLQICDVYSHLWGVAGQYLGSESLQVINTM